MYNDMANPNPNTDGLKKPQWRNIPTVAIRIPEIYKDEVMQFARSVDSGNHAAPSLDCEALNQENQRLQSELENLKAENEKLQRQIEQLTSQGISVHCNELEKWHQETLPKLGSEKGYKPNSASQLIKELKSHKPRHHLAENP